METENAPATETAPEAPVTPEAAIQAAQAAAPPAAPPVETEQNNEPDPFEDDSVQTFDRAYVEKLRKEAAERRTKSKKFEESFGGWAAEDVDIWLETIQLASHPDAKVRAAAAERLETIKGLLVGDIKETPEGTKDETEDDANRPLTAKELEERLEAERRERELADETHKLIAEARELGYKEDSDEWFEVFNLAISTKSSLRQAHEKLEARKQAVIDEYLRSKQEDAYGHRPLPKGATQSLSEDKKPKTFQESREAVAAFLKGIKGQV